MTVSMTPKEMLLCRVLWSYVDGKPYSKELRECLEQASGTVNAATAPPAEISVPSADSLVPSVPPEYFTDTEMDDDLEALPEALRPILRKRLQGGRDAYAGSFCGSDLKADFLEEADDLVCYVVLMRMRARRAGVRLPETVLSRLIATALEARQLASRLPDFEGPLSSEWVEERDR